MERMTLVERILWAIKRKKWSQSRLEREAGLSKGYISTVYNPSTPWFRKIDT